jgi:D-glycero-alpha-D-manno-heptose 1-phosphate guanylyltransferase
MSIACTAQTCVILAGGLGTRLRDVIHNRPKCLAPVGNRTFIEIQVTRLIQAGITDIVLSLGYGAEQVISLVSDCLSSVPIRYEVEPELLGTGGAIAHVLDVFGLDEVLVANGDTYLDGDLSPMLAPLDSSANEQLRMAALVVPDRRRFGGVESDTSGHVVRFLEKGQHDSGLINAGLYRLCRAALPKNRTGSYSLETDVLPSLVEHGRVMLAVIDGTFTDIGVPADYERFCVTYAT